MRLLNVQSMKLEEYFGSQIPRYAILSHCWGSGEVTFEDINRPSWHEKEGAKKVKLATQQAKKEGLEHIWIDTCCIDKSSSAELSEAINSMYAWYEHAVVCFAYLEDIIFEDIENSKWFTRGWTLQEMVAPTNIMFFDKRWILLGTKIELVGHLSRITSISEDVLLDPSRRHNSSVARKMSWASTRETTRMEDMAYSLLGIFNVNMPLLYGEGKRAFARLQEEILKETDDHSLFAWIIYPTSNRNNPDLENACGSVPSAPNSEQSFLSILAESPANFRYTGKVVPYPSGSRSHPCSMTSRGLSIDVRLRGDIAALECHQENDLSSSIGIDIVYV
ncbi:HET-domain-containing protein, partial [Cadophora sp. DSE1049]